MLLRQKSLDRVLTTGGDEGGEYGNLETHIRAGMRNVACGVI